MKTATNEITLFLYGFYLAAVISYNKTMDMESLFPFTYTSKGVDAIKRSAIQPMTPETAPVISSIVTYSTVVGALKAGPVNTTATNQDVQQTVAPVSKDLTNGKAAVVVADITSKINSNLINIRSQLARLKVSVTTVTHQRFKACLHSLDIESGYGMY